eukprot:8806-Heterococcus_DN1.PRE.3
MPAISKTAAVITVAVIAVFGAILRPNIALAATAVASRIASASQSAKALLSATSGFAGSDIGVIIGHKANFLPLAFVSTLIGQLTPLLPLYAVARTAATSAKSGLSEIRSWLKIMAITSEDTDLLTDMTFNSTTNTISSSDTAVKTIISKDKMKKRENFGIIHDSSNSSSMPKQQQSDVVERIATAAVFIEAATSDLIARQSKRREKIKALAIQDAQQEVYDTAVQLYKNLEDEELPVINIKKIKNSKSKKKGSDKKVYTRPLYIAISTRSGIDPEIIKYSVLALVFGGRFAAIAAALSRVRTDAAIDGIAIGLLVNLISITLLLTVGQTYTAIIYMMFRDILSGPIRYLTQVDNVARLLLSLVILNIVNRKESKHTYYATLLSKLTDEEGQQ